MPKKAAISATRRRMVGVSVPRLSSPKASSCHTLSVTIWFSGDCWTKPMRAAWVRWSACSRGASRNRMRPCRTPWGARVGFSCRSRVDLPQPDGPHSTRKAPSGTVRVRRSMAGAVCPG